MGLKYHAPLYSRSSEAVDLGDASDFSTLHSAEIGLRGLTEDEKRTVGISTISVATRLALESKSDEVHFIGPRYGNS